MNHQIEVPRRWADGVKEMIREINFVECLTDIRSCVLVGGRVWKGIEVRYLEDESSSLNNQFEKIDGKYVFEAACFSWNTYFISRVYFLTPLPNPIIHVVIQASDFKFVFVVRCRETSNYFVLKELSCPPGKHFNVNFLSVEPFYLSSLHANLSQPFPGVITPPQSYCEYVRVSLVYEMMTMDLFTGIEKFANKHRLEGVTEDIAIVWLAQLIRSVKHLSSRNIVHRDLKPENIFLDNKGNCVLGDFELAEAVVEGELWTKPGGIVGTPLYIPPEVFTAPSGQAQHSLEKSDMWALGIIGYELISNTNPWDIDVVRTSFPSMCKIITGTKPRKSPIMSDLYWDFIQGLLRFTVEERFGPDEALAHPLFNNVRDRIHDVEKLWPKGEAEAHPEVKSFVKYTIEPNCLQFRHKVPFESPVTPTRRMFGSPFASPNNSPNGTEDRILPESTSTPVSSLSAVFLDRTGSRDEVVGKEEDKNEKKIVLPQLIVG